MTKTVGQTDIFSMFGIEDKYAEEKLQKEAELMARREDMAKKAEERKKGVAASPSKPTEKKADPFNVDQSTYVYHLGQELPILDYFSVEEITSGLPIKKKGEDEATLNPISAEDVRKRLEKHFPDLVAAYTEMVKIEKKNMIMAIPKAKKKGLNCKEESSYEDSSLSSKKKIPASILNDFITLSKEFAATFGVELHADIYFDLALNEFFMDIPHQEASRYTVERTEQPYVTANKLMERKFIKVMEIHSHHYFSTTPSSLDNQNERQENMLYAIIGSVDHYFPEITVRVFSRTSNRHYNIDPGKVFETPFSDVSALYDTSVVEVFR
ncbi:hypothetical protein D5E69_23200 (plasmid) [Rossellomorea marisflavi]|uniref:hypothetical protein n=1 Tax=Rossellomorea marisflavi TaxID=189381 RepID=UPI0013164C41|nr:hypothetical protein [Rossellomorea marisflavi]QHA38741.1 hypothetical protein D5E69_23200 [Rossellomorea marisflavi]